MSSAFNSTPLNQRGAGGYVCVHILPIHGLKIRVKCLIDDTGESSTGSSNVNNMGLGTAKYKGDKSIKSNVFIWPFVHQLISQSAVQKPSLKPQTASNAGVEACWLGKTP